MTKHVESSDGGAGQNRSTIPYSRPTKSMAFDGERFTTAVNGPIEHEHLLRYLFARQFCRDQVVLDVASGEGYGAALLAQVARQVVGVEISKESVSHAQKCYTSNNLRFIEGNCLLLPLETNSVDVVTCYETIEHITEHDSFLSEVRRVLRPGGTFLISTPDRIVYSEETGYNNPFHMKELSHKEFEALISKYFVNAIFFGQNSGVGSFLFPIHPSNRAPDIFFRSNEDIIQLKNLDRPRIIIAVASDGPLPAPASSVYYEVDAARKSFNVDDDVKHALERTGSAGGQSLCEVFSLATSTPKAGLKTEIERVQGDLVVTALDEDSRLELPLGEAHSRWLLLRAVLVVEEKCIAQIYFSSGGENQISNKFALYRTLQPGVNRLHILLRAEEPIDYVRFDPADRPGRIVIRDLVVLAPC